MGEIFRREIAEKPERFTGERLTGEVSGQIQLEHYHRYLLARSMVAGADVLDVASGEGYGSALLAQVARSVVGVEFCAATARSAQDNFPKRNLRFVQGDARALPLADRCMDAVVSFETIEHFERQQEFVREVHRVLREDGIFIVSTPDRDVYSPASSPPNRFHVHELSRDEFVGLLRLYFPHVQLVRQRALVGSALLSEAAPSTAPLVFDRRGDTHFEACIGLPRAPYLLAVASGREQPPMPPSLYIDRGNTEVELRQYLEVAEELRQAHAEIAEAQRHATEMTDNAIQSAHRADQARHDATEAQHRSQLAELRASLAEQRVLQAEQQAANARQVAAEADRRAQEAQQEAARARDHAEEAARRAEAAEHRRAELQSDYTLLRGSARTFLRGYLPLLRRHLLGARS